MTRLSALLLIAVITFTWTTPASAEVTFEGLKIGAKIDDYVNFKTMQLTSAAKKGGLALFVGQSSEKHYYIMFRFRDKSDSMLEVEAGMAEGNIEKITYYPHRAVSLQQVAAKHPNLFAGVVRDEEGVLTHLVLPGLNTIYRFDGVGALTSVLYYADRLRTDQRDESASDVLGRINEQIRCSEIARDEP